MTFLIYIILGLITILPWFTKAFVRWVDHEWKTLPWDPTTTVMAVFLTLVAVFMWPLVFGIWFFSVIAIKFVHRPFVKMFERERQIRLSKEEKDNG